MTDCEDDRQDYDCDQASRELDAFVRGELPAESMDRMRRHLEACGGCKGVAQYEQGFRDRLRRLGTGCCPDRLRRKIEEILAKPLADDSR